MFSFLRRPTRPSRKKRRKSAAPSAAKANASPACVSLTGRSLAVLQIAGREVEVRRRPDKRSIGLTLNVNGRISVSAPRSLPLHQVREFVISQRDWIIAQSREYEILRANFPRKTYREGEKFPFLGEWLTLRLAPGARLRIEREGRALKIFMPANESFDPAAAHPELAPVVAEFFEREGRLILAERVALFAERTGLKPSALVIRSQKTRWGSCSSAGQISLNWRLVVAPLEVIDYVGVHELAHLRYHNHSVRFWSLVRELDPDFQAHREWLGRHQYEADFLAKRSELHD